MPAHISAKPKTLFRRLERWFVGFVMTVMAFVLEKMVMRSVKRSGSRPESPLGEGTSFTTKGGAIEFDPER